MKNLYVGNLSYGTTAEDLEAAFSAYGHVERVNIIRDRETGQSRGFAFVEMTGDDEANNAMTALNGSDLQGRTLNVTEARPREEHGGGAGGQRRGGGRGDYGRGRGNPRW